jgi:hypothetical protein
VHEAGFRVEGVVSAHSLSSLDRVAAHELFYQGTIRNEKGTGDLGQEIQAGCVLGSALRGGRHGGGPGQDRPELCFALGHNRSGRIVRCRRVAGFSDIVAIVMVIFCIAPEIVEGSWPFEQ